MPQLYRFPALLALLFCAFSMTATEYHGRVMFSGLPLPGATIIASQGDQKVVAVTGLDGTYSFPNLADGDWSIQIEMLCFAPVKKDVTIAFGVPTAEWELKLLPADEIKATSVAAPPPAVAPALTTTAATPATAAPAAAAAKPGAKKGKGAALPPVNTASGFQRTDVNAAATPPTQSEAAGAAPAGGDASDSFAINGSVNNGAASAFGQSQAFGNNRRGPGSLYNGAFQIVSNNSALDAENYSVTGQNTPKPSQNLLNFGASVGGPLRIPHLINPNSAPTFFVAYQLIRNHTATTNPYLVPTAAQREGDISATDVIPQSMISPQALSLLRFYPLPNFAGSSAYNYQTAIRSTVAQDSLQSRLTSKTFKRSNQLYGGFSFQNTRNQNNNLFSFLDHTNTLGYDINANWNHRFTQRLFMTYKVDFNRQTTQVLPFFANKENVSGEAGITGNNQNPLYWGPPSLSFSSGIAGLSDANQATNKNQTVLGIDRLFHSFSA